jgi:putative peptidoglycan lipid II flippase
LFPTLSRLAARNDVEGFRLTINAGLRQIGFLLVPAALVSALLSVPVVRLVYERGAFEAADTDVVAGCLAAFSLGLVFNGWMLMLTRGFYSLQSNWLPTTIAIATLLLNAALDALLYRVGIWGIPLATSLTNIAGTALMLLFLRRRTGGLEVARAAAALARITAAAVAGAALGGGVWLVLDQALGRALGAQLVSLGVALAVAAGGYLTACRWLRVGELGSLLALAGRRPAP